MNAVEFKNVDIVFGPSPKKILALLDQGQDREEILKSSDHTVGVHDASISVEKGKISVLMGLSGSGKSTLLRCVNGLNRPTRGQVLVRDRETMIDVASCDKHTLHRLRSERISMVFQQFALLPWRTVEENVGLGLELNGISKHERHAIVQNKLKLVNLEEWGNKFAHELSGGMQQRVGLARAFATDADILLMDEPFSALDPLIRNHLQDELLDLQTSLQKTIIFVSHDLEEAVKLGTHIGIMKSGKVVQYGTPEEIILSPANEYVEAFVSHLNPVNLLKGTSLMTPLDQLKREGQEYFLDRWGSYRLSLTGGNPIVRRAGQSISVIPFSELNKDTDAMQETMLLAKPDFNMKALIEYLWASGTPVLMEEEGKVVGVVGEEEIYQGILHSRNLKQSQIQ
ncbi:MAG: choline ABC transporter ATP-binding protein [SAR324 cluster bacterium]|nr:choline ABC transporter ATP-binding protein [SAR324 cluster bacterium]